MQQDGILYLGDQDVVACGCSVAGVNEAVEAAFRMQADGMAAAAPSLLLTDSGRNRYAGKSGTLANPPFSCMKWYGYFGDNANASLPLFNPLVILNEGRHGLPVAIMSGKWISEVRTAAVTAVAAKYMARKSSSHIAFIGCGAQARSHLAAMREIFPLARVSAYSRTLAGARRFIDNTSDTGIEGVAFDNPRDALSGCDIVVSTVPRLSPGNQSIDASWLPPGSFSGMMDLGFAWRAESLTAVDRLITDDLPLVLAGDAAKLNYSGSFSGGLADIVSGKLPGRLSEQERNGILFGGTGLADLAAAVLVYEAAISKRLGMWLRR